MTAMATADGGGAGRLFSPSRLLAMVLKEFVQMRRDRLTLAMMVGIPVIQLLLFGYAIDNDPKRLPTVVLSRDTSDLTRSLVAALQNTEIAYPVDSAAHNILWVVGARSATS